MGKVQAVEGVRGIACLMVVLSHLSLTFFPYLHGFGGMAGPANRIQWFIHHSPLCFFFSGTAAVYVFFVLSGYILTKVALERDRTYLVQMAWKRYPRLMLPAVVSCILAWCCFAFLRPDSGGSPLWISGYGTFDFSFGGALVSGMYEAFFLGKSAYNWVLWTMKIELLGSFIVFVLCWFHGLRILQLVSVLLALTLLLLVWEQHMPMSLGLVSFLFGYWLYLHAGQIRSPWQVGLLGAGLYLAGVHSLSWSYQWLVPALGTATYEVCNWLSGLVLVHVLLNSESLRALCSLRPLVFMGRVSFSVYLIHMPVLATAGVALFNLLVRFLPYNGAALLTSAFSVVLVYWLATYYYRWVDRPSMALAGRVWTFAAALMNRTPFRQSC